MHNEDSIRARQFNNLEYNFLMEWDGQISALLIVRPPAADDVSSVVYIQHAVYDAALPADEQTVLLEAMLAEVEDFPRPAGTGCRLAQTGDYMHISRFLTAHAHKGQSCAVMLSAKYNGPYGVYTRLYEKQRYYLLSEQEGELLALLELNHPSRIPGNTVLNIATAVFREKLDEAAARQQLALLTDYAAQVFGQHASKLRYACMHPRQQWMREAIQGCGFEQTACFPAKLQNGSNLMYFDRLLP